MSFITNTALLKLVVGNKIVSFQDLAKNCLNVIDERCYDANWNCFHYLLKNAEFFQYLTDSQQLTYQDLKFIIDHLDSDCYSDARSIVSNSPLFFELLENFGFIEIVDVLKSRRSYEFQGYEQLSGLHVLFENDQLLQQLFEKDVLSNDDLKYLWNNFDERTSLNAFQKDLFVLEQFFVKKIVSFRELVDKCSSVDAFDDDCLTDLLNNDRLFEFLINSEILSQRDLFYLLDKIDNCYALIKICNNSRLIEKILSQFLLNSEYAEKFNKLLNVRKSATASVQNVFDLIKEANASNCKVFQLAMLNQYVHSRDGFFDANQRLELIEFLKSCETAQNRLIQIIDNHLESNYDFDSLMNYLKKTEKKNLINI